MKWIKLIWDFHGAHSKGTAEHHAVHLEQFSEKENIIHRGVGAEAQSQSHYIAFLIVHKDNMIIVRDALRPARAVYAENQ